MDRTWRQRNSYLGGRGGSWEMKEKKRGVGERSSEGLSGTFHCVGNRNVGFGVWSTESGARLPERVPTVPLSSCVTSVSSLASRRVNSVKASYRIVGNV